MYVCVFVCVPLIPSIAHSWINWLRSVISVVISTWSSSGSKQQCSRGTHIYKSIRYIIWNFIHFSSHIIIVICVRHMKLCCILCSLWYTHTYLYGRTLPYWFDTISNQQRKSPWREMQRKTWVEESVREVGTQQAHFKLSDMHVFNTISFAKQVTFHLKSLNLCSLCLLLSLVIVYYHSVTYSRQRAIFHPLADPWLLKLVRSSMCIGFQERART